MIIKIAQTPVYGAGANKNAKICDKYTLRKQRDAEASFIRGYHLAQNFSNNARANGTAAFTDCETQTVVHRDWGSESQPS